MNLGIGDAFNLAWKLALVAKGDAQLALLDSYETERIGIAREVLQSSDRGFELEATQDELLEWIRIHVFPLLLNVATNFKTVRNMVFKLFSQTWIAYPDSPIVEDAVPANDAPKAGERAPYGQFVDSQQHSRSLFELLRGVEHNLLLFEGLQPDADFNTLKKETQELLDRYRIASRLIEINQINRSLHGRYGAEKPLLVFIRPDGHIAYRGQPTELDRFENYLSRLYCKS